MVDTVPKLKYVEELPTSKRKECKFDALIQKFVDSGKSAAIVENATKGAITSVKSAIERLELSDKVKPAQRSGVLYLAIPEKE